jgi:archaeosortase B (VPXXXP-CTERM-specific)
MSSQPPPDNESEEQPAGSPPGHSETRADEEGAHGAASLTARLREAATNPANRFVVLFLVYLAALAFFYPKVSIRYSEAIEGMAVLTAWLAGGFTEIFSDVVKQKGTMILFGGFAVEIIEECTGLYEMLIYAAAVLAFPTSLVKKGIGIAAGIPILYAINVLRIIFLLWVGRYYPDTFDFMHLYFWQATLILMITSVWLLWIFKVVRHESPTRTA